MKIKKRVDSMLVKEVIQEVTELSLDALNEAKERDMDDSFVLSGTSAKFRITFGLI
ncbi:MAG: hypothetical protein HFG89_09550 [Dorea sp.]|jgi:hypothetical protein|nr:hypothetical protein [Dorea sp.]